MRCCHDDAGFTLSLISAKSGRGQDQRHMERNATHTHTHTHTYTHTALEKNAT